MTYAEMMAIITPICFSISFSAVPYLNGRKTQRIIVLCIVVAFAITEIIPLSQVKYK